MTKPKMEIELHPKDKIIIWVKYIIEGVECKVKHEVSATYNGSLKTEEFRPNYG